MPGLTFYCTECSNEWEQSELIRIKKHRDYCLFLEDNLACPKCKNPFLEVGPIDE